MLISRVCQSHLAPMFKCYVAKTPTTIFRVSFPKSQPIRTYSNEGRSSLAGRLARHRTLREKALEPAGDSAASVGRGAVAGGAVLGLGALCYYGLGFSKEAGIVEHAMFWPEHVKQRIKATYLYFGGSIVVTAASAAAVLRSPTMLRLVTKNSFLSIAATLGVLIASGAVVQGIPYKKGFGAKQIAWIAHSAILGAVIAPICLLGGPLVLRAAWYTAGVVGGLSAVAVCAPSERFLYIGGPLAIGLGVVFAASIGSMFLPATSALGAGLYSISMYGGLLLFSGFLLYDTQRIVKAAEMYPLNADLPFDPVNMSVHIYMDTINIFIRIAMILAGGGGNRRK